MSPNDRTLAFLRQLEAEHFYGWATVKYEDGQVVHIERKENIRPENLPADGRAIGRPNTGRQNGTYTHTTTTR